MRLLIAGIGIAGVTLVLGAPGGDGGSDSYAADYHATPGYSAGSLALSASPASTSPADREFRGGFAGLPDVPPEALADVIEQYCQVCHNDRRLRGNMSLEDFDIGPLGSGGRRLRR